MDSLLMGAIRLSNLYLWIHHTGATPQRHARLERQRVDPKRRLVLVGCTVGVIHATAALSVLGALPS